MKLLPEESVKGLHRIMITAIWGVGTLLLGTLIVALVGLLLGVSNLTPLGMEGALVVVVLACVVALIVWRRLAPRGAGRQSSWATRVQRNKMAADNAPSATPSIRKDAPTAKSSASKLQIEDAPSAAECKRRFNIQLEAGNFDAAEQIVAEMETRPDESQWCANARRRLQFKRARRN